MFLVTLLLNLRHFYVIGQKSEALTRQNSKKVDVAVAVLITWQKEEITPL